MPRYSFTCKKCGTDFTVNVPWNQKDEAECPNCRSKDKQQDYSKVAILSGSGSGSGCNKSNCTSNCSTCKI
jgi:putative FmdB family regulatory protein